MTKHQRKLVPMRVLLLANGTASSVTARTRVLIKTLLNDRYEVELALTQHRGHASRLAYEAAMSGIDAVVVLGGDGTLNEVANGLAGTKCALAALPGGSTNVFARTIGTDDDPLVATTTICNALDEGRIELIGLGEATPGAGAVSHEQTRPTDPSSPNSRLFLFHCGIGFDAAVVNRVERRPKLKRYLAHPLYMMAAVETWLRSEHRNTKMTVSHNSSGPARASDSVSASNLASDGNDNAASSCTDGITSSFTVVLNTDPYTYLGSLPLSLAPAANLQNGLSVIALRSTKASVVARTLAGALKNSDGLSQLDSTVLHRVDNLTELTVCATGIGYQIDGEYLGKTDCLQFTHRPRILPVVIP